MRKIISLVLMIIFLIPSLAACYDAKEVDEWAYVYSIGVDKGKEDKIRFTVQIPKYGGQSSGAGGMQVSSGEQGQSDGKQGNIVTISVDCPTLYAGVNLINTSLSRTLNYMHCKYIIVSEDFAKEGVSAFVDGMRRARQIRRIMHFIVVKGEASKFLKELNPVLGVALSKFQEGMMSQEDQTALFDDTTYGDFINEMKSTKGQAHCILAALNETVGSESGGKQSEGSEGGKSGGEQPKESEGGKSGEKQPGETKGGKSGGEQSKETNGGSSEGKETKGGEGGESGGEQPKETEGGVDYYAGEVPRSGGNKFEFLGTALFDGDKMVGELNGDETRVMLMAKSDFTRAAITVKDPKEPKLFATCDVKMQKKSNVKITFKDGKPNITLKIFLEGDLVHLQSDIDYESEELKPELEEAFKSYIKEKLDKTIDKCKSLSCDVFGFGDKASMQFLTIQEWEEYNWNKQFKDAEVTCEVEFVIRRTGTVIKTNEKKSSKDEDAGSEDGSEGQKQGSEGQKQDSEGQKQGAEGQQQGSEGQKQGGEEAQNKEGSKEQKEGPIEQDKKSEEQKE